MRSHFIEALFPAVEALLLRRTVSAGRSTAFILQGPVHALVRSVVLRFAGTGKLDLDPLSDPPHAQLAQPPGAHRGKGRPVVYPDDLRQTVTTKGLLKAFPGAALGRVGIGLQGNEV